MKSAVVPTITQSTIKKFVDVIPNMKRSQIIRRYLLNETITFDHEIVQDIIEKQQSEEKETFFLYLNEQSLRVLASYETKIKKLASEIGHTLEASRSAVLQHVMNTIAENYKDKPIVSEPSKIKPFYLLPSDKKRLLKYINKREVTSTIEQYIMDTYNGPTEMEKSELKAKPAEKMELIQLSLDNTAIEEMDEYAAKYGANRSQILRNVVKQILDQHENKYNNVETVVYGKLDSLVEDLRGIATENQIMEAIEKYQTKRN